MLPDEKRLLTAARTALTKLTGDIGAEAKATLEAIDAVLIELLLRTEHDFYVQHHAEGLALFDAGMTLAKELGIEMPEILHPRSLPTSMPPDTAWSHIESLRKALEDVVRAMCDSSLQDVTEVSNYLRQVVDWENRFHARHSEFARSAHLSGKHSPDPFSRLNLESYLRQRFPEWGTIAVGDIRVLLGGFSKKTVLFDVSDDVNGKRSLVIRAEQPPRFEFWDGDQVQNEFVVLQLTHEAGLPVAEPLWIETDRSFLGERFLVSRKAEGRNAGNPISTQAVVPAMLEDLIRNLVRIHNTRLDPEDDRIKHSHLRDWARYKTLTESTSAWVDHWRACIRIKQLRASPLTVRMMEWLKNNVPITNEAPSFLHGDFGFHNVLFQDNSVSCVLDWEYATFGDPAEDIALLSIGLGQSVSKQQIMELYRRFGGRPIGEYRLRYFDVLYCMKFIVPCENALKIFQEHETANIGLCKFGFQYTYAGISALNEKIALAEQAKARESGLGNH